LKTRSLSDAERLDWLRLARSQNVGPVTFAALIGRFHSATVALDELPRLARRGGAAGDLQIPTKEEAERELKATARLGGRIIACVEPDFPAGLAALDAPLPLISVLGDCDVLSREMIAVVGRHATRPHSDANSPGSSRLVLGMGALWSSRAWHAASIRPRMRERLRRARLPCSPAASTISTRPTMRAFTNAVKEEGAIVSEMPLGLEAAGTAFSAPQSDHLGSFARRCCGGSRRRIGFAHHRAICAGAGGARVFAVPGSPLDPRAKGTNRLLREGAALVESAEDVLDTLRPLLGGPLNEIPDRLSTANEPGPPNAAPDEGLCRTVLDLLGPAPISVDDIVRQTGATAAAVVSVILELELAGQLYREANGRVCLA